MNSWSRRALLASVAGGAGLLVGLAPRAHADATLPADVRVTDWATNEHGVSDLWFELTSSADRPIDPAPICWGAEREAQQPWTIVNGPGTVAPGATATYHITVPVDSPDVHLLPGERAILFVYDRGRDVRTQTTFTPMEGA